MVVLLALAVARLRDGGNETSPDPGGPTTTEHEVNGSTTVGRRLSLGVELLRDGRLRFHVPVCDGVIVTDVTWLYPATTGDGVWTVSILDPNPLPFIEVGGQDPSYRTVDDLDVRWEDLIPSATSLASATRRSGGVDLAPANLGFAIDELVVDEISYSRQADTSMVRAASASEFQAAVSGDCEPG